MFSFYVIKIFIRSSVLSYHMTVFSNDNLWVMEVYKKILYRNTNNTITCKNINKGTGRRDFFTAIQILYIIFKNLLWSVCVDLKLWNLLKKAICACKYAICA